MQEKLPYIDYSTWIRHYFPYRVQKISIDAGFTCPNRDGRISTGGCTFCNNDTFNPAYCSPTKSVTQQLEEGKEFFARKYPEMKYLAYFQAYSNTYAPLSRLKELYEEALAVEDVVGIVIGTRPDCVTEETLDYLKELSEKFFVVVEYGIESVFDDTLRRVNRGHSFADTEKAVMMTHQRGILCGGHVIIGLPGDEERIAESAKMLSQLPLNFLKIHQLQIIRNTQMAKDYEQGKIKALELDEYMKKLALFIQNLRDDIVLERFVSQSPADLIIAPKWGLKNHEFTDKFKKFPKSPYPQPFPRNGEGSK